MNTTNDGWLIATAPAEVQLFLLVITGIAAVILLLLAIEDGYYPEFIGMVRSARRWLRTTRARIAAAGKCWKEVRYVEG